VSDDGAEPRRSPLCVLSSYRHSGPFARFPPGTIGRQIHVLWTVPSSSRAPLRASPRRWSSTPRTSTGDGRSPSPISRQSLEHDHDRLFARPDGPGAVFAAGAVLKPATASGRPTPADHREPRSAGQRLIVAATGRR
jgi:hypothetical protein